MKTFNLIGKNIVLTGVNGFMGKKMAHSLRLEGANVFGVDVVAGNGTVILDITKRDEVQKYAKSLPKIDGLINNAAINIKGASLSQDDFMKTMEVNLLGSVNMTEGLKANYNKGASIVNVSSVYGHLSPDPSIYDGNEQLFSSNAYGISKSGIIQMTKYYAKMYGPDIRVNAISPGGIFDGHNNEFIEKYSKRVALKRMAKPEEIINVICFLLSDLSSYVSGADFMVDGGMGI
jgi:NAD(P)-dependent dehydrogenase (short-subunit alcohol dehydrogenase family)